MEAIEFLMSRYSVPKLDQPGPDDASLKQILDASLRAPDHGLLRPWSVILIRGDSRARFGEQLAKAMQARNPSASPAELEKERNKPLRAPLVIAIAAVVRDTAKIPALEQHLSAGCVAHALVLAAQAKGFGAIWRTGDSAYDRSVHEALGLGANAQLVGFVYIGTPAQSAPEIPRPEADSIVREW